MEEDKDKRKGLREIKVNRHFSPCFFFFFFFFCRDGDEDRIFGILQEQQ